MRSAGNTSSGLILFALVALTASAGFVRLGIWQLERHREVRAANATKAERLAREPVRLDPSMLRGDSTEALIGRRVEVRGRWETDREVVIRSRARAGTPGIHVVTPLRLDDVADDPADGPSSILVLRGWQSSVDAVRRGSASADSGADGREHLLALVRESRTGRGAPMVRLGGDDGVP
ncbi:MAG: SURF1 family protein, partial [Gemmatimonadota bacterium]|nr:SURF1 family protein [Gemmatimonadota bacterium]